MPKKKGPQQPASDFRFAGSAYSGRIDHPFRTCPITSGHFLPLTFPRPAEVPGRQLLPIVERTYGDRASKLHAPSG